MVDCCEYLKREAFRESEQTPEVVMRLFHPADKIAIKYLFMGLVCLSIIAGGSYLLGFLTAKMLGELYGLTMMLSIGPAAREAYLAGQRNAQKS